MSDAIDWVVDMDATLDQTDVLAIKVLGFLTAEGIVLPSMRESRWSRDRPLFEVGPHAADWSIQACTDLAQCGLEIVQERRVFHTGDNGIQALRCPLCSTEHPDEAVAWSAAVEKWYGGQPDDAVACPACQQAASVTEWRFLECEWGFGHLGFGFNNWAIDDRLASAIADVLGHRYRLVHEHT